MLDYAALRQGEAEFYIFGQQSQFPFTQTVTDLRTGGVAYYCKGRNQTGEVVVEGRILVGMDNFWSFLQRCIEALPRDCGLDSCANNSIIVMPSELREPKRIKLNATTNAFNGHQQSWDAIVATVMRSIDHDVANLEDLDAFVDKDGGYTACFPSYIS